MDEDLKAYLQGMEERTAAQMQGMEERTAAQMQALEDRTAALIGAEVGGLHTANKKLEDRLVARFNSIDARLKLQAGLIQAGARAMARFSQFSEESEERWVDLLDRIEKLEKAS